MTSNVHDHLAKEVFQRVAEARTLLRAFLPDQQLRALDLESLRCVPGSFVDEQLRERQTDLLFSVRCRDAPVLVYLLFEHKSTQDRWLVLQLLGYINRIWSLWRKQHGERCRLPMILSIVLYHGGRPWSQPLRLIDLCDAEGRNLELLGPSQPTLPLTLIDLSRFTEAQIESACAHGSALATLTMLIMKSIRGTGLVRRLRAWTPVVRRARAETGGRQMLELLVHYLLLASREEVDVLQLKDVLSHAVGSEAEELVMNTGEKLIRQGEQQGMREGMREALASGLVARFGAIPQNIQERMKTADLETLQRWHARAIVVEGLDEAFDV